ncbi:MAG: DUF6111 family protein [Alphaproteobacteria bacterium]|nr:DUF6111 family protein [Alphaproteobacteria bacterium]
MLALAEIGLFLFPTALYVAWLYAGNHTPRWAVWVTLGGTAVIAAGIIHFGITNAIAPDAAYVPAHIEDGHIVPGHAAPKRR